MAEEKGGDTEEERQRGREGCGKEIQWQKDEKDEKINRKTTTTRNREKKKKRARRRAIRGEALSVVEPADPQPNTAGPYHLSMSVQHHLLDQWGNAHSPHSQFHCNVNGCNVMEGVTWYSQVQWNSASTIWMQQRRSGRRQNRSCFFQAQLSVLWACASASCFTTSMLWMMSSIRAFNFSCSTLQSGARRSKVNQLYVGTYILLIIIIIISSVTQPLLEPGAQGQVQ